MSRTIRLSLLALATTALVACGGGAKIGGGKEGAAKALFDASQPAGQGGNKSQQGLNVSGLGLNVSGLVDPRTLASAADTSIEVAVDCAKGGSVKLKLDLTSSGSQSAGFKYKVSYDKCSQDGVNSFKGDMTMEYSFAGTGTSLELAMRLKGKIEISGDIDDFIDADVTESVAFSATSATSGSVTVKLNGSIKTSDGSYTYANESLTITAGGSIPMADDGNS
jgi:hypothetical protein